MDSVKLPFYVRASIVFIGLFAFIAMLYFAQHIIVPVIYATIIAIVLNPLVDLLTRRGVNRVVAISISLVVMGLVAILFFGLIATQVVVFRDSFPKLWDKMSELLSTSIDWAAHHFNVSADRINDWFKEAKVGMIAAGKAEIGTSIATLGSAMVVIVLIPVYVFMTLFYQPLLLEFIHKLFPQEYQTEVNEVLVSVRRIIQRYLLALLIEAAIIAVLNSAGLLLIGIDYAIALGVIGALLNVIPYIGGIIAIALPIMVAIVTKSSITYPLLVIAVYSLIQFIDNHYIIPKIVASRVRLNALVSIIAVLTGGALWGLPGMFLSIPLTAILKIIFDHITPLKPLGFLLGDTMPPITLMKFKKNEK